MLIVTSNSIAGKKIKRLLRGQLIVSKRRALKSIKALRTADLLIIDRIAWSWFTSAVQRQLLQCNTVLVIC